jgi:hypothetical protein
MDAAALWRVRRCYEARNVEYWPPTPERLLEGPGFAARSSPAMPDIALVCGSRPRPPMPPPPSQARGRFVVRHPSARPKTTVVIAAATIEDRLAALSLRPGVAPASSQARFGLLILGPASTLTRLNDFEQPNLRTLHKDSSQHRASFEKKAGPYSGGGLT